MGVASSAGDGEGGSDRVESLCNMQSGGVLEGGSRVRITKVRN